MFDIGFLEIMVIMIIGLLVIGPERMPEVARKLGTFMGKMRNFINQMKEDSPLKDTVQEVRSAMDFEQEKRNISNINKELQNGLNFDDTGINKDDFQSPFGDDTSVPASSQYNKTPAQPKLNQDASAKDESFTESSASQNSVSNDEPKAVADQTSATETSSQEKKNS